MAFKLAVNEEFQHLTNVQRTIQALSQDPNFPSVLVKLCNWQGRDGCFPVRYDGSQHNQTKHFNISVNENFSH